MEILNKRKRWIEDGSKPRYGFSWYKGEEHLYQYIWDNYHDYMVPVEDQLNTYKFNIQVYDSPDGDTWWEGTCKFLNGDTDVEILSECSNRR
jgi:hypothetical protein